jgi:hypothetical protein
MSGGYIKPQDARDHQVVIFTFAGAVPSQNADAWNSAIGELKQKFGASITGVTMVGNQSPTPAAIAQAQSRVAARSARSAKSARGTKPRKAAKRRR